MAPVSSAASQLQHRQRRPFTSGSTGTAGRQHGVLLPRPVTPPPSVHPVRSRTGRRAAVIVRAADKLALLSPSKVRLALAAS
jgi:hypothetical protein